MSAVAEPLDAIVVGAGFGGLGAALSLAESGRRVALLEALAYPGGCASTFERGGARYEAGATLFAGLAPGQLFGEWIRRHRLSVEVEWIDPVVELRTPELRIRVDRDPRALAGVLARLPGAPAHEIERFFALQRRVADLLWTALDRPELLPPLTPRALLAQLGLAPRAFPHLPLLGTPLGALLRRRGLDRFPPLVTLLDALCRITVQCGVAEADALLALGALGFFHRGAGHIVGGIGELATGLLGAIERAGGEVSLGDRVRRVEREGSLWRIESRKGVRRARAAVLNLLPADARALLGAAEGEIAPLDRLARRVRGSWGACTLYLIARAPECADPGAAHFGLIADPSRPLVEGNHVFCSVSSARDRGRVPGDDPRLRTITLSTHFAIEPDRGTGAAIPPPAERVAAVQERMRRTLALLLPEWARGVESELPASPRTWERFTGRSEGRVGGIPKRAGDTRLADLFPRPLLPGLWLAGDSVLLGQSTLATAIGGTRVAAGVGRRLPGNSRMVALLRPASLSVPDSL